jgi:hypothetical protein
MSNVKFSEYGCCVLTWQARAQATLSRSFPHSINASTLIDLPWGPHTTSHTNVSLTVRSDLIWRAKRLP